MVQFKIVVTVVSPSFAGSYEYMDDLQRLDACRPWGSPTSIPSWMDGVVTPLRWRCWEQALSNHPDPQFRDYVVSGIREGFRIGFDYSKNCTAAGKNTRSANQNAAVVSDYLLTECSAGRVIGPFPENPNFNPIQVNRFGVIPKGTPGKWRLIVDLSFPEGTSVNDGIQTDLCSLRYVKVDDAAREIEKQGHNTWMAKIDIQHAYRIVPIHPEDRWLLGMQWQGNLFVDTTLPFGLRSAPKIFTALADAVEWVLRWRGVQFVIHYLDDFFMAGSANYATCSAQLQIVLDTFEELGIPIARHKLEGPTSCLTFLGFELDSVAMEVRLPQAKLSELQSLLQRWIYKDSCLKKELESLVGKLAHACKVVKPGKTFLRHLYQKLAETAEPYHHVRFNVAIRSDLMWWAMFLQAWNGVPLCQEYDPQKVDYHIWTDASGSFGCGAVWGDRWLQAEWSQVYEHTPEEQEEDGISLKELLPVVLACAVWGPQWRLSSVVVHCDNESTVAVINTGYSRVVKIMHLLRCLFFIKARFNMWVKALHVPGRDNIVADAISRNNLTILLSQIPSAQSTRDVIPDVLLQLLMTERPDWTSPSWSRLFGSCFQVA